jgi:hypothetical protein
MKITKIHSQITPQSELPPINSIFDDENGIGSVPLSQEIQYRGFTKIMTPEQFRKLVPPAYSKKSKDFFVKAIQQGKKIGHPFLMTDWNDKKQSWQVTNHEGRSRSDAIATIYGQIPFPVHILPNHLRARNIIPEMMNATIMPQKFDPR